MSRDQSLCTLLLSGSVVGIVCYGWLVLLSGWNLLVLQLTVFIAVTGILGIVAWIGYTLATTLPPQLIDFEKELVMDESVGVGGDQR